MAHSQVIEPSSDSPERPITFTGRYVIDLMGVASGGEQRGRRVLGNLELTADADFDRLIGWHGARAHLHMLDNHGRGLNDLAGTVQGVNNIEVTDGRLKLYEAWLEQSLAHGRAALLLGLSDLNADFYQNDAAGLLIAPAFGIGLELSATGPNGPSIFPSTALTARLNVALGKSGYVRVAAVNARAGVLGDEAGVDVSMQDGALLIAEAGTTHNGKLAVGAWRYTRRQDDLRAVDANGDPVRRISMGAYVLVEHRLLGDDTRGIDMFLRAGVSDGKTTSFSGGAQIGVLGRGLIPGRPDGQFSLGIAYGVLSRGFRDTLRDTGEEPEAGETGVEITYQDKLAPFLSVQPDLQYIRRPYAGAGRRDTLVVGLRLIASFDRH
ncbi:carbohydrate porin [Sphingomonas sp. MMS24-J45]|uniref:carbohydrate porin n=1 Tax=Sphingomonas sp. MMS24-J45 TaxID=3238806 RepID=UPI00384EB9A5